jgi:PHD/YefM family antitoxin component YafN of YafNO toxin-antitoxin module
MKDDKKYIALMDAYKQKRLRDPQGAQKYLEAAMELKANGEVSHDATIGAAYL